MSPSSISKSLVAAHWSKPPVVGAVGRPCGSRASRKSSSMMEACRKSFTTTKAEEKSSSMIGAVGRFLSMIGEFRLKVLMFSGASEAAQDWVHIHIAVGGRIPSPATVGGAIPTLFSEGLRFEGVRKQGVGEMWRQGVGDMWRQGVGEVLRLDLDL
ncbi:hypothetical protein K438DRAFT_1773353 [Mycena galopus ATCC 62051]|nr:hypothetical protein K438DRAFT_1773353 [Mycena galopus ATCC 62051]